MSALSDARQAFVVCWTRGDRSEFCASETWPATRELFEERVRELAAGERVEDLRAQYSRLDVRLAGGGIAPAKRRPVGVFRAPIHGAGAPLESFIFFGPRQVPVVGAAPDVDRLVREIRRRAPGTTVSRYGLATADPPQKPPSESQWSPHAKLAADRCIRNREPYRAALRGLSCGELLWVGEQARKLENARLAVRVADLALKRAHTPGALTLKAAALRDLAFYDASLAAYDEAIELQPSAKDNPYAHIGRGATLRRLGRDDEAYDSVKKALRWWPDDEYALRTRDAILHALETRPYADAMI